MRLACLVGLIALPMWAAGPVQVSGSANFWKAFLDEEGGFAAGGAVRVPLTRRLAVRPEFVGGSIQTYRRFMILGSVTFDVTNPEAPAVGYLVGSVGLHTSHDRRISYTHNERATIGGAGVRYNIGGRWVAAVEARFGLDAFPLIGVSIGYKFGR